MADCGGVAASSNTHHVVFRTATDGTRNGIPLAGGNGGLLCVTPGTVGWQTKSASGSILGINWRVQWRERTYTPGSSTTLPLGPIDICCEMDLEITYRTINGQNHAIAICRNLLSTLSNSTNVYGKCSGQYYGTYMGRPFAYAIGAALVPNPDRAVWQHCLGGWKNDPTQTCYGECSYQKMGGTWYNYGCLRTAAPFSSSPDPGRLNPGPYEFDLGPVNPGDNVDVYIFGRAEWSTNRSNPCAAMTWVGNAATQAVGYDLPPLNVCPPDIVGEEHGRNVCDNCATVSLEVDANDLLMTGQALLVVDYVYDATLKNVDWSKAETTQFTIYQDKRDWFTIPCLIPSAHYAYRAKIVLNTSYTAESEYTYGEFDTLYIPKPNMSVPPITEAECSDIDRGGLIPPFEEDTAYAVY